MALIPVKSDELFNLCNNKILASCSLLVDNNETVNKVHQFMTALIDENSLKYEALGLHYIITSDVPNYINVLGTIILPYAKDEYIKLLSMTNNLSELTSIPVKDGSTETNTQNGGTFSMSENQPINATETITTPYIKVNGKNNYTLTKDIQHNTVNEYKTRQEMMNGNVQTIFNFIDSWMEKLIYEYNIAY